MSGGSALEPETSLLPRWDQRKNGSHKRRMPGSCRDPEPSARHFKVLHAADTRYLAIARPSLILTVRGMSGGGTCPDFRCTVSVAMQGWSSGIHRWHSGSRCSAFVHFQQALRNTVNAKVELMFRGSAVSRTRHRYQARLTARSLLADLKAPMVARHNVLFKNLELPIKYEVRHRQHSRTLQAPLSERSSSDPKLVCDSFSQH